MRCDAIGERGAGRASLASARPVGGPGTVFASSRAAARSTTRSAESATSRPTREHLPEARESPRAAGFLGGGEGDKTCGSAAVAGLAGLALRDEVCRHGLDGLAPGQADRLALADDV